MIIHLLRKAIEMEVDLSKEEIPHAAEMLLQHANIVIPWLWRASQHGIQSDFAQSAVNPWKYFLIQTSLWLLSHYRETDDLEREYDPIDDEIIKIIEANGSGMDVLEVSKFKSPMKY